MKKNKYELYTLNREDEFGDSRVSDVYFVALHGFDTDARGHKLLCDKEKQFLHFHRDAGKGWTRHEFRLCEGLLE